jgi:hypothetical protein
VSYREFVIRDQHLNFGADIKGCKFVAFEMPVSVEDQGLIHVVEMSALELARKEIAFLKSLHNGPAGELEELFQAHLDGKVK